MAESPPQSAPTSTRDSDSEEFVEKESSLRKAFDGLHTVEDKFDDLRKASFFHTSDLIDRRSSLLNSNLGIDELQSELKGVVLPSPLARQSSQDIDPELNMSELQRELNAAALVSPSPSPSISIQTQNRKESDQVAGSDRNEPITVETVSEDSARFENPSNVLDLDTAQELEAQIPLSPAGSSSSSSAYSSSKSETSADGDDTRDQTSEMGSSPTPWDAPSDPLDALQDLEAHHAAVSVSSSGESGEISEHSLISSHSIMDVEAVPEDSYLNSNQSRASLDSTGAFSKTSSASNQTEPSSSPHISEDSTKYYSSSSRSLDLLSSQSGAASVSIATNSTHSVTHHDHDVSHFDAEIEEIKQSSYYLKSNEVQPTRPSIDPDADIESLQRKLDEAALLPPAVDAPASSTSVCDEPLLNPPSEDDKTRGERASSNRSSRPKSLKTTIQRELIDKGVDRKYIYAIGLLSVCICFMLIWNLAMIIILASHS